MQCVRVEILRGLGGGIQGGERKERMGAALCVSLRSAIFKFCIYS